MKVGVRLFATLAAYLPDTQRGESVLDVPAGTTVGQLIGCLRIPETLSHVVLVNGHEAAADRPLSEGDELSVFPPLAGG